MTRLLLLVAVDAAAAACLLLFLWGDGDGTDSDLALVVAVVDVVLKDSHTSGDVADNNRRRRTPSRVDDIIELLLLFELMMNEMQQDVY
jgi:hypothetical protein